MSYDSFDSFENSIEKMLNTEKRRYNSPFSYFDEIDVNRPKDVTYLESKHAKNDMWLEIDKDPKDRVNSPSHYTRGKAEAIDTIEDAIQDAPDPKLGMLQGQVLKYLLRLWLKDNPVEDAKKARWYLDRLIGKLS